MCLRGGMNNTVWLREASHRKNKIHSTEKMKLDSELWSSSLSLSQMNYKAMIITLSSIVWHSKCRLLHLFNPMVNAFSRRHNRRNNLCIMCFFQHTKQLDYWSAYWWLDLFRSVIYLNLSIKPINQSIR